MKDKKEGIVVIPKKIMEDVKKGGVEKEFNEVIKKLQNGDLKGSLMDMVECDVKLVCNKCNSNDITWILDKASDEVIFNCRFCHHHGWMTKKEYQQAVRNNTDCIIKNQ